MLSTKEALDFLNDGSGSKKYPEMSARLKQMADVYYGMSLHTLGACPKFKKLSGQGTITPANYYGEKYQCLFDNHLLSRYPRESEETRNWRYSQYRPLTKAPFSRISEIVTGAIFQDGNYSLEISNKDDYEYIWGNNFQGNNIIGWYANIGYKSMVEDPNGLVVRMPKYPWYEYDGSEPIEVDVLFINICDVKFYSKEDVIFCYNGYAWHIDEQTIFRYYFDLQTKKYILAPNDADGYYAHMLGRLPVSVAGGIWNSRGYFDSFYDKAKPAADDFISSYSSAQLIDKEASHPFITEVSEDCPDCTAGQIQEACTCGGSPENPTDCNLCDSGCGYRLVRCGTCKGTGKVANDPARRRIVPADQMGKELVQITNPDVGINKNARETVKGIMQMILDALHLTVIDEAQSGAAKAIDQEGLYKFVSRISNHIFDNLITETLTDIIAYRNVTVANGRLRPSVYDFKIVKPSQFQIKTAAALLDEFKTANEAKVPKSIQSQLVIDYVDKQYSGNDVIKKKTEILVQMDYLYMESSDDLVNLKVAGVAKTEDIEFSKRLPSMLDAIIRDKGNEWFIQSDYDKIKAEVDRLKPEYVSSSITNPITQGAQNTLVNGLQ